MAMDLPLLLEKQFAQIRDMLSGMIQIDNLDGLGKV